MRYSEQKKVIAISYGTGILLNYLIELILDNIAGFEVVISSVRVVSILTVWWWFYFKIGWRLPILKRILFRIDLNGTWFGKYVSHDHRQGNTYSGKIAIRIVQDYLNASLISRTQRYRNFSYSAEVKYDKESETHGIVYAYSQKESGPFDTGQRNGASELTLALKDTSSEYWLEGEFWTIHGTQGTICVKRICRRHIDSFDEAKRVAETGGLS